VERLDAVGGLPLGVSEDARYAVGHQRLEPGDALLVLSDGVTEAEGPGGALFGDDGVTAWLAAPPTALAPLVAAARTHESGGPASDDLAALLMRFNNRRCPV
jgi:serine phosphatase RsbU (regulator of sigma subunit)